jgi:hypothetical protein
VTNFSYLRVINLQGHRPASKKTFLASLMSTSSEPFQRTDISTQPLGPSIWLYRVSILKVFLPEPSGPAKIKKTFKKWTQCIHRPFNFLLVGADTIRLGIAAVPKLMYTQNGFG